MKCKLMQVNLILPVFRQHTHEQGHGRVSQPSLSSDFHLHQPRVIQNTVELK